MSEHKIKKIVKKLKPENLTMPEKIALSYIKNDADIKVKLTEEEELMDEICKKIFAMMLKSRPKNFITNWLLKEYPNKIKDRKSAWRYIEYAEYIYGKGNTVTKEMANAMLIKKLQRVHDKAESSPDPDLKLMAYCAIEIAKAQKEMTPEEHDSKMPAVIFSNNPQLLKPKELDIEDANEINEDAD